MGVYIGRPCIPQIEPTDTWFTIILDETLIFLQDYLSGFDIADLISANKTSNSV